MKASEIQNSLHLRRSDTYAVLLPNYTPERWHECDMFGVTRAGYFHEFEIKLTKSDFKADAKKRQGARYDVNKETGKWDRTPGELKHDRLFALDEHGPSRFWYVAPSGLIALADLPTWAGLLNYAIGSDRNYGHFETAKDAPQLHRKKVAREVLRHAMNVCYYRLWHVRHELARLKKDHARLSAPRLTG